ncbi:MAG: acyl-CoA dehydrogenase family protein [Oscillospiraceae bacterium]|nr:acyl-CoA dehydrogenase family protein [Oscillospiraceae bacterium]
MDFKFNADQEMIQQLAKEFAEKQILPRVDEIGVDDKFPADLYQQMADTGLLGIAFDEKYGGAGLGYDCFVLAIEQIAKVSATAAKAILVTLLLPEGVRLLGTEAQKERYIVPSMTGEVRGAMAFTEPDTGSDPKQLTTTARRDGDDFILNGVKRFISGAGYPGPILVYANEEDTGLCTGFLFDKFCEGYSLSTPWKSVGFQGSPVYDIFLDNVRVPAANMLGKSGDGFPLLLEVLARGKLGFSAVFLGTMLASYEAAVKYAKEKMHRGAPITKFQTIQVKIANIAANYESARWMLYKLGQDANNITDPVKFQAQSAMVKYYISELAVQTNVMAMDVLGSYGVMEEYRVERFLRDSLIGSNVEGASDIQRVITANYILNKEGKLY